MTNRATRTADKATELIDPIAMDLGLELVQVRLLHEQGAWVLRVLVDKPDSQKGQGVTIADCTKLSRELADVLDVENLIPDRYRLEVSSPGLNRPLIKDADFERFKGLQVVLKTRQAVDGARSFHGLLMGMEDAQVILEIDGEPKRFQRSLIERANLVPEL